MNFEQATQAAAPFITAANAAAYAAETDKMLWVEDNIMSAAGINSSICTVFGERVCEWVEVELCNINEGVL
jgi:hypothetical protein